MNKILALIACAFVTSCSTMNFVNGPKMSDTVIREQWHHLALNGVIEISEPMDINYNCASQQWDSLTIERTFLNHVASSTWPYLALYSPWSIVYECRESID